MIRNWTRRFLLACCTVAVLFTTACDEEINMARQPRINTYEASSVFPDGASARPFVEDVVDTAGYRFTNAPETTVPPRPALTADLLLRGREVFNISCRPCHGEAGYGDGMVQQRGYPQPPSYHSKRLRELPDEHFFHVITAGLGKMPPYFDQVPNTRDRWALVAYIRALQLSQHASPDDWPEARRPEVSP